MNSPRQPDELDGLLMLADAIASDNLDGESSHRNVEHFHAVVLPGAHDPARFLVDEKRMTCDRCGGWLVRLDDGVTLDEILAAASTHECAGEAK